MIEKVYPVSFEIAGPAAMFTRPDTGVSPVSYPVPTKSAVKSIAECVVLAKNAYFEPRRIEICLPVVYHKYTTNYGGPLREKGDKQNFQFFATILENVCYKVYGVMLAYAPPRSVSNPQHQLQEVFLRRLALGQFHSTPFLGWKEFVPTYFGPVRDTTAVNTSVNLVIPSLLVTMYDQPTDGSVVSPRFIQDARIEEGVMFYAE